MTLRPCIECGEPTEVERCDEHRLRNADKPGRGKHNRTAEERGYDYAWRKLSQRARRLQPFCSDCGATDDLQTDHSAEAWKRKAAGKPIRLRDVDVVCGPCNRKRGAARETSFCAVGSIPV
jgi:5-methylcytosine-specific restriction enzyme A